MDKNLERDFEEFKQALANVEAAYGELVDYVEIVGGVCKAALNNVERAPLDETTIEKVYRYMLDLNSYESKLQSWCNIINAEVYNALLYYDSLRMEFRRRG